MTVLRHYKHFRYVLPVSGALLAGMVGVAAYTAHHISGRRRRNLGDFTFSPWEVQVRHEQISFVTEDGVTIRGWWFARPDTRRVIVGCTGHRGTKADLLGIGSGLWRSGNNVLLFDYRGCGESDHALQSLAHHELRDARAAIGYAQERVDDARIGIIGYSMGAAVAIQVAAADPSIRAVVADSPFATMRDVVAYAFQRRRVPTRPTIELTDALTRLRYGYRFHAVRPLDVVGQIAPRPLLIIHGTADTTTPVEHGRWLYDAANEPKELWLLEGVTHCGAYFVDRPAYVARVAAFFARALGEDE
ncbi:MAG TPA: alpha/beta fold hydrolase [Herpetosiphonaceae bacterium]